MYDCFSCICSLSIEAKSVSDPLELELQMIVSHQMGTETQNQLPWKSGFLSNPVIIPCEQAVLVVRSVQVLWNS